MDLNLPFKNVIIPLDKIHNDDEDYIHSYRTSISFADIENMGGRAGNILNVENVGKSRNSIQKKDEFGRVIFLAYSLILETVYQNIYFNFYKNRNNHICKIRKDISKTINNKNRYVKRIRDIFKTVPGRGLMLDIKEKELKLI